MDQAAPDQVSDWLRVQKERSVIPKRNQLLVETFPRGARFYMVCYPFEGRWPIRRWACCSPAGWSGRGLRPTGFVASDYALGVWGLGDLGRGLRSRQAVARQLFDEDMLGDDLEAWMADSYLLKRMFRNTAL